MSMKSLNEIITEACELSTNEEKVEFLKKNNSKELRNILILMYDKKWSFCVPSTAPPYNASIMVDTHGALYREARKLAYLVNEMPEGENLTQVKKESIFIQMLENVDEGDAKLLLRMVAKAAYPELPVECILEAFGPIIVDPVPAIPVKRGRGRPKKVA